MAKFDKGVQGKNCGSCFWFDTPVDGSSCREIGKHPDLVEKGCKSYERKSLSAAYRSNPRIAKLLDLKGRPETHVVSEEMARAILEDLAEEKIKLPKAYRRSADGKVAQGALERSSDVREEVIAALARIIIERSDLVNRMKRIDAELLDLKDFKKSRVADQKAALMAVYPDLVERHDFLVSLMEICFQVQGQMDFINKSVSEMTKAHYATVAK